MPKATAAELQLRVRKVQKLLLGGRTRGYIIGFAAENWQIGERQVDEYLQLATAELDEANKTSAERNIALITANLWRLFREQVKNSPAIARQALMDIAKIRGLDRLDINLHVDRPLEELSDKDLEKALGGFNGS